MEEEKKIEMEYEIYVLTGEHKAVFGGSPDPSKKRYSLKILAYVMKDTDELVEKEATIWWTKEQNFEFQQKSIYLLKCNAKVIEKENNLTKPKSFYLEKIIKEDVVNEKLVKVLDNYNKPVVQYDEEFGEFILDKKFREFEGNIDWLGKKCDVFLNCRKDINEYSICINFLKTMYPNIKDFNKMLENFVVSKLLDTAIEWNDNKNISEEFLISNLSIDSISINSRGGFDVRYCCKDIFEGHNICVRGNFNGKLIEAVLEG